MYQSPEQEKLEQEALRLQIQLNQQIEKIGEIISQLREILGKKGGEKDVSGIVA